MQFDHEPLSSQLILNFRIFEEKENVLPTFKVVKIGYAALKVGF